LTLSPIFKNALLLLSPLRAAPGLEAKSVSGNTFLVYKNFYRSVFKLF
jgi:hypothetical protein